MDAESGNVAEITVSMNHPYNENVITAFPRNVVDKRTDLCYTSTDSGRYTLVGKLKYEAFPKCQKKINAGSS